ncbi:glycoside hydrolase family 3 N-terminal domain-containing protein [Microbacterium sp. C7(2022)]|uniref:beta-xylosidase/alpha-l-arabinosidase n=1 Tax=Microbacterium sp. C7(2022) TaxID=2992759 RepID=UPI00237B504F|nr:glycoside hydrolase family 3 N-terminal domain-containing protein [Microbacterium sp. C7(2022)]MDE0545229.1 glycoside hydrolase family 3 C-terminal domain-containing protein [Microbacterium sp. C7(2022)]
MTLEEKVAQLVGFWVDQGDETVAPMAGEMATSTRYEEASIHGMGHLTRVYGTRPVDPSERAGWLWSEQRRLRAETRLGIPAIVHEECLTGLATWKAATYPTPLAWGAAFDPELVEQVGTQIGESMRELGIHQGLAPVLDVVRDPRWGRVDECIGEDPYLVGTVGTAYVRGLQSTGIHATLKHFVGYSASQAGRNHAPVSMGRRELEDVMLPPFEMAIRDGAVRSVMNSYAAIDGIPVAATPEYLTEILRDRWGFDGVVVSDYFSVAFLHTMHAVAADLGEAAHLALEAGIDVELPTGDAFVAPLIERLRDGRTDIGLVDQAVLRVLRQKEELGLLDETFDEAPQGVDLDSSEHRSLARRLAGESVILLSNDGILPLARTPRRIAVIGPNADASEALMGCYSFANHVLPHHPGTPLGFDVPTVLERLTAEFADTDVVHEAGCDVEGDDESRIASAVNAAREADVVIAVVGDRAGLFGRGTVGEGNDVDDLELPGLQRRLVEELRATGTPVVMVCLTGRPYALGWAIEGENAPAAVLQTFFPGEEGADAIAAVLSGREAPSGHLPVSLPRSSGSQPYSYLHPLLGGPNEITSADNAPVLAFGHGLTYSSFERRLSTVDAVPAGGRFTAEVRVRNTGSREATDLVQLYAHDEFATVARPLAQLVAYTRVSLAPGDEAVVRFDVPTTRFALTDRSFRRVVQPGDVELWVGPDCRTKESIARVTVSGDEYLVTDADPRVVDVTLG